MVIKKYMSIFLGLSLLGASFTAFSYGYGPNGLGEFVPSENIVWMSLWAQSMALSISATISQNKGKIAVITALCGIAGYFGYKYWLDRKNNDTAKKELGGHNDNNDNNKVGNDKVIEKDIVNSNPVGCPSNVEVKSWLWEVTEDQKINEKKRNLFIADPDNRLVPVIVDAKVEKYTSSGSVNDIKTKFVVHIPQVDLFSDEIKELFPEDKSSEVALKYGSAILIIKRSDKGGYEVYIEGNNGDIKTLLNTLPCSLSDKKLLLEYRDRLLIKDSIKEELLLSRQFIGSAYSRNAQNVFNNPLYSDKSKQFGIVQISYKKTSLDDVGSVKYIILVDEHDQKNPQWFFNGIETGLKQEEYTTFYKVEDLIHTFMQTEDSVSEVVLLYCMVKYDDNNLELTNTVHKNLERMIPQLNIPVENIEYLIGKTDVKQSVLPAEVIEKFKNNKGFLQKLESNDFDIIYKK